MQGGVRGSTEHQGQFKLRCLRNSSYIVKYGWGKNPPSIHSKIYTPFIFYHWPFPFPHIKKLSHSFQKEGQDFKISGFSFSNRLAGDTFKTHTHKTCTHTYPTHTDPTHTYDNNQYKYDLCKLVLSIKGIQNVCKLRAKRQKDSRDTVSKNKTFTQQAQCDKYNTVLNMCIPYRFLKNDIVNILSDSSHKCQKI